MNNYPNEENLRAAVFQQLEPYISQEKIAKINGEKIAPDTTGVDYFFLIGFLTPQMEDDFSVIEHEFLTRCRNKLVEFNEIGEYGAADIRVYNPIQSLHAKILRLIYNGAKADDEYCVELIRRLYKTYHRKEYNQLKKFARLSGEDVVTLSENNEDPLEEKLITARVLVMGNFLGIKIDENCSLFYYMLEGGREVYLSFLDKHLDTNAVPAEKIQEYGDQLENMLSEAKGKAPNKDELYSPYLEATKFIAECFKQHDFSDDYMQLCTAEGGSRTFNLIQSLAILKKLNPNKDYSLQDIYVYSCVEQLITAFTDIIADYDYEVGFLLGDQLDETEMEKVLFKPVSIISREGQCDNQSHKLVNVAPIEADSATQDDYLQEINKLRGRVRAREQDIKDLRDRIRELQRDADEAVNRIQALETDREELIALRNYAYSQRDEDDDIPEEDELSKMRDVISEKKIAIIGGHQKWHNKLRKLFPKWSLIYMDEYKSVTESMLENKDFVFFFTDYITHKSYKKCVRMLRDKGIEFGYLKGINSEIYVKRIYEKVVH